MKERGKEQEERGDFGVLGEGSKDFRMTEIGQTYLGQRRLEFPNVVPHCGGGYPAPNVDGVWQILQRFDYVTNQKSQ